MMPIKEIILKIKIKKIKKIMIRQKIKENKSR